MYHKRLGLNLNVCAKSFYLTDTLKLQEKKQKDIILEQNKSLEGSITASNTSIKFAICD